MVERLKGAAVGVQGIVLHLEVVVIVVVGVAGGGDVSLSSHIEAKATGGTRLLLPRSASLWYVGGMVVAGRLLGVVALLPRVIPGTILERALHIVGVVHIFNGDADGGDRVWSLAAVAVVVPPFVDLGRALV